MELRTVNQLLNVRHYWHTSRRIPLQKARLFTSLPRLHAPSPGPKPRPWSQGSSSRAVPKIRQAPAKSKQSNSQHNLDWRKVVVETFARWRSEWRARYAERLSRRLAVRGLVVFISGMTLAYFLVLEPVPITGRRRVCWVPQFMLAKMEEMDSQVMENVRENAEKDLVRSDYPGLRKIEAVLKRLVEASGLDDIAWEVRVLDEPSRFSLPVLVYSSAGRGS